MSNQVKIVLLGATSMSFGLSFLRDIFSSSELRGCTLTLVGRHPDTLAKVFKLAQILNAKCSAGVAHRADDRSPRRPRRRSFRYQCNGD